MMKCFIKYVTKNKVRKICILFLVCSTVTLQAKPENLKDSYTLEYSYNYIAALQVMERLIDENSQSYFYQLRAGWLAYMAGNMSKSVDHYQKAIALRPESIEARIGQMLPLTSLGKYEQVETVAFSTLKLDQHNYTAKSRLAYSLYLSGRFKEAEKYYAELVTQYPSDTTMITGLAWSRLKQGKKKSALEAFYQAREILPGNQQVEEGIALCLSEK